MAGYFEVQSLPRRVRMLTRPASMRACMRYPSNFISCSQSVPSGAAFTSAASSGFTQAGGEAGSPLWREGVVPEGVARPDFAIPTVYQKFAFFPAGYFASTFGPLGLGI